MPSPLLTTLFGIAILAIGQIVGDHSSNSGNEIDQSIVLLFFEKLTILPHKLFPKNALEFSAVWHMGLAF